ncbi:dihydrodipicolinate synthase family protein [Flavobacteriaceae bacterium F89]|uniref:Dihydrodipicolinate synthase family protein n=1 Tax=Cerina litoralis TaxID=2874477 RepID=A0AAE3EU57_9FLAO|nr:dihydrodipicolinate synthase family protein [Cerina litoralis]MCG2461142.1 dihydrodipicolinate synthase family protein [Cerina litoralis]
MKDLIAATYAPMHKDGSLNLDIVKPYGKFLKSNKVAGAFVNGSTGDFVSLSTDERKQVTEAWSKNKPSDFHLVCHVGHNNLREARELASHAEDKVDGIAALAPYYFRLNSLGKLLEYCSEIAQCAPKTPFYYYHIPVLTGANFQMIDFLEMAGENIPNFAGIKYTQSNLIDFQKCMGFKNGSYKILFGVDEQLLSSLPYGAEGWVGSTYNHLAPLYYQIISSFKAGDMERATNLQQKAVHFVETLDKMGGFNGTGKSFMRLFGLDLGPSRFPHTTLSDNQLATVVKSFDKIGLLSLLSPEFNTGSLKG